MSSAPLPFVVVLLANFFPFLPILGYWNKVQTSGLLSSPLGESACCQVWELRIPCYDLGEREVAPVDHCILAADTEAGVRA